MVIYKFYGQILFMHHVLEIIKPCMNLYEEPFVMLLDELQLYKKKKN